MNISDKQIKQISKSISILDIKSYIEKHRQEFEQFLKEEEENKNDCSA